MAEHLAAMKAAIDEAVEAREAREAREKKKAAARDGPRRISSRQQQLEEARAALKGVHAMLAAFESVDVVREQLQPLLTEAAAAVAEKLASAERRRAEACLSLIHI